MTSRTRANGEGSIFPYRNGFAAYVVSIHGLSCDVTPLRVWGPRGCR